MTKGVMIFVVLVVLVVGGFFLFRGDDSQTDLSGGDAGGLDVGSLVSEVPAPGSEGVEEMIVVEDSDVSSGEPSDEELVKEEVDTVKEFTLDARRFSYSPDVIRVSQGDQVKITVNNLDTTHGMNIRGLGVRGNNLLEFTADEKGTFTFYCDNYCGGGHSGMSGTLIVE